MFNELPKGFKEVETDRKKELVHTCTINDDGQVIFGTKFLKKGSLLSKKEATFVKLLWNESEQQLIFAFASEEEIHGDDPDFDESSLGEEIFKLEKGICQICNRNMHELFCRIRRLEKPYFCRDRF